MKYTMCSLFTVLLLIVFSGVSVAQQPARPKRPVKNPPQFPNIIDLEGKDQSPAPQTTLQPAQGENAADAQAAQATDALTRALQSLVGEMKTLSQEIRALNIRNQAQLDTLRLTRIDMRIDHYERELRPVRDRLATLEAEEQTLFQLMTRESLQTQTALTPTFNRDDLIRQLRLQHETRLRAVQAEKERLRKLEADLIQSLNIYQKLGTGTEQRIQDAEGLLKQLESSQSGKTEKKQQE